jgi:hypothetical protein
MTQPDNSVDFFNESINVAKRNITEVVDGLGQRMNAETALRIAEIQVEMAKAVAIVMVSQQLAVIGRNLDGVASPGKSIRYGMEQVAASIYGLKDGR